ncbi:uridine kinase [Spongisporangium articulatum]|uniref:Uridine kinase n=1 Tax=Spongisporangium articulatum TaxID=3362603 RepID=A0ABW8ARA8_9ACTN
MPDHAAAVLELALSVAPSAGRTRVVAVDGPSGAGKSSLVDAVPALLEAAAPGTSVAVVHLDDVYPGWNGLEATPPLITRWLLEPLAAGEPAGYRRYDWAAERYAGRVAVPAVDVLLLDGVGSGARVCSPYLAALVWVEAPPAERYRRAMVRDGEVYRPYWHRWAQQEAEFHAADRTRERADLMVSTESSEDFPSHGS